MDYLWFLCAISVLIPNWGPSWCLVALKRNDVYGYLLRDRSTSSSSTFLNRSFLTSWVWTLKVQGKRWNSSGLSHPRRVSQSWESKIFKRNKGVSPLPGRQRCLAWGTSCGRDGASLPRQPHSCSPSFLSYGPGGTMPRLCWTPENQVCLHINVFQVTVVRCRWCCTGSPGICQAFQQKFLG